MSEKPEIINLQEAVKDKCRQNKVRQQSELDELDSSSEDAGIHALVDIVEMIFGAANMDEQFADLERTLCGGLESAAAAKVLWTTVDDASTILAQLGT